MKLHCHRQSLATAFQIVGGVVPSRTPKEILKNVLLQVSDGKAMLVGTDQEVGIRYEIPRVEIEMPGETLLPAGRVSTILRELTHESVDLEVDDRSVVIRSGQSEFQLSAEDAGEFPPVAGFEDEQYVTVTAGAFREAVRRTIFATDDESTRYALGGILLDIEGEKLILAATDSRRLAAVTVACRSEGGEVLEQNNPVVPSKAMSLIEKSLTSEDDEEMFIAVHANDVVVKCGNSTVYSLLVEGRFPRYADVIPAESGVTIEFVAGPFHSAVRQGQIVTSDDSRGVDFQFTEGTLTLNSKAAEIGQSKIELPISYSGGDLTITFDPRFVSDFLRVLDAEQQVKLGLTDGESAALFQVDDQYTYVVMPLSKDR